MTEFFKKLKNCFLKNGLQFEKYISLITYSLTQIFGFIRRIYKMHDNFFDNLYLYN